MAVARKIVTRNKGNTLIGRVNTIWQTVRKWTARRIVTLDIDSTAIRLLETRGTTVTNWASVPLNPGEIGGEAGQYQPALGAMVKRLMASSGIKARRVVASLTGLYSVSRILTVPKPRVGVTPEEAVLERAKETLPLSGDKLYLSWQTIAAGEGGWQVLVFGIRRDVLDSEVRALRAAGINPHIVELKAMALTRAVNREQAIILNIEPLSFDTIIALKGVPEVMHTTAWQPGNLAPEDQVEHLARTLGLTVDSYNARHPDLHLDSATPLFITGPMSADGSLVKKLQSRLGYAVEPLAARLECPANLPAAQYAVNIGLALKRMWLSRNPGQGASQLLALNLLPPAYRPWRPSARQLYMFGVVLAGIALIFPLAAVTTEAMSQTGTLQVKYNILNDELQRRQKEIQDRQPWQKAVDEYRSITTAGGYVTTDLEVINREARKLGVRMQSISHDGKTISVLAEADDYVTYRKYLTALEESGRFATPVPPPEGYPYTKSGIVKVESKKTK